MWNNAHQRIKKKNEEKNLWKQKLIRNKKIFKKKAINLTKKKILKKMKKN